MLIREGHSTLESIRASMSPSAPGLSRYGYRSSISGDLISNINSSIKVRLASWAHARPVFPLDFMLLAT